MELNKKNSNFKQTSFRCRFRLKIFSDGPGVFFTNFFRNEQKLRLSSGAHESSISFVDIVSLCFASDNLIVARCLVTFRDVLAMFYPWCSIGWIYKFLKNVRNLE